MRLSALLASLMLIKVVQPNGLNAGCIASDSQAGDFGAANWNL